MESKEDVFKQRGLMSPQRWEMSPKGQHIELGIAEMNLFLLLAAAGLSHAHYGERLIPIGTLYDPFICRGLDALNHACYQDSRFIVVATPSGISLAPEGGAHQSIGTPLIGMAQDGLASFEPAYIDELVAIMGWAFDYVQREGKSSVWERDASGGSVYLRLSTRPIEQHQRADDRTSCARRSSRAAIGCAAPTLRPSWPSSTWGRWRRKPSRPRGCLSEDRRGIGVLAVTSADRLSAGWHGAQRAREHGHREARAHVEELLSPVPRDANIITVCDAYPETLSWIGSVSGHRVRALGVEHFGQSGSLGELYGHYGLDVNAILTAAEGLSGRPVRYRTLQH